MTRKHALMRVCEMLDTYEQTEEIREIRAKIAEVVDELPLTAWTEATIFDAIEQWVAEHGKVPSTRDLARKGLPPAPVIKNRFKMNAKAFLDRYYPKPALLCPSTRYGGKTQEEWVLDFVAQYKSICPRSAAEYNQKRTANSPGWATVAAICGLQKWNALLAYCKLEPPKRAVPAGRGKPGKVFSVQRQTDVEEVYAKLDRAAEKGSDVQ